MLLFHPAPGRFVREAYVKIGYFRGPELLYQDVIEGDLFAQVDRAMDLLYSKYTKALISYDGIYRVETFPVPKEAMREAVINAVIHRDYASTAPIQIRVYDHRITLWNPGQLPPDWSVEQLTGENSSRPHNPGIAYAFFPGRDDRGMGAGYPADRPCVRDRGQSGAGVEDRARRRAVVGVPVFHRVPKDGRFPRETRFGR